MHTKTIAGATKANDAQISVGARNTFNPYFWCLNNNWRKKTYVASTRTDTKTIAGASTTTDAQTTFGVSTTTDTKTSFGPSLTTDSKPTVGASKITDIQTTVSASTTTNTAQPLPLTFGALITTKIQTTSSPYLSIYKKVTGLQHYTKDMQIILTQPQYNKPQSWFLLNN